MIVKEEMLQKLAAVIAALDTMTVSGQKNLGNLYGSIVALREIVSEIAADGVTVSRASEGGTA